MARKLIHFSRYAKPTDKCITKYCRNKRKKERRVCSKCHSASFKQRHPLKYYYNLLRCGAYARGIEFTLTYERYEQLAKESGLQDHRGRTTTSLSVDRIDNSIGYTDSNVRICTLSENSSKGAKVWSGVWSRWNDQSSFNAVAEVEHDDVADNCPF